MADPLPDPDPEPAPRPPFAFDADTTVIPAGPGRWRGEVTDRWDIGAVPNGGYVLSVVLAGLRAALRPPHPLTVSAHYLSPCAHGPVDVEVEVLKEGRSLSTAVARLVQAGRSRLVVLATFGDLAAQRGPTLVTVAPPALPDPEACPSRITGLTTFASPPSISQRVEFRPSPETARAMTDRASVAAGAGHTTGSGDHQSPQAEGWVRFADGRPLDPACLPLLCDALPPAVMTSMATGWVPTLELTVHVRAVPIDGWLRASTVTRVLVDGLLEEDCELWDGAGRLVAMSRQLARAMPPA